MALPDTNISTTLVGQTLGSGSRDVGTLCTHPNINKWSKWKPVRDGKVTGITNNDLSAINYGLDLPMFYSATGSILTPGTFLYSLKNNLNSWTYLKPRGGANFEPYRLGDFRNYNHQAIFPIEALAVTDYYLDVNNSIFINLGETVQYPDNYNITLRDFSHQGVSFSDCYLGVLLFKDSSNDYIFGTSPVKISNEGLTIELTDMGANKGTWLGKFFISSVPFSHNGNISAGFFVPIELSAVNVNIKDVGDLFSYYITGSWNSNKTQIETQALLVNNSGSDYTYTNIVFYLVYTTGSQTPDQGTIISTQNVGDITVGAKSSEYTPTEYFSHTEVAGRQYWVGVKATNLLAEYTQVEEPY